MTEVLAPAGGQALVGANQPGFPSGNEAVAGPTEGEVLPWDFWDTEVPA